MKPHTFFLFHALIISSALPIIAADEPLVEEAIIDYLRIVQDPDGHTNIRSAASLDSTIAGKVPSGGPVFVDPAPENGFHMIFLEKEDGTADRYIHASRLKPVKGWKAYGPEGNTGVLRHAGFEAAVHAPAFVSADHKITRDAHGMILVNGKLPWGQDGGEPSHLLKLDITIASKPVTLPAGATDNLYEPNFETLVLLTPGDPADRAILMMANGDGAGGYYVVWAFEKGVYKGRAIMMP